MWLKYLIISMRPKQWVKNTFIFAPLIFAGHLFHLKYLITTCLTFIIFCGVTSAVYLFNDLYDLKRDQLHPEKSKRPIASGKINLNLVRVFLVLLLAGTLIPAYFWKPPLLIILVLYVAINMSYTLYFKTLVILDILCIAAGFVLRVLAGSYVLPAVFPSPWIIVCTLTLSLFLGFVKRRGELSTLDQTAKNHRQVLADYSFAFLDQLIMILAGATVISYAIYTASPDTILKFHTDKLIYSVCFVIYGVFRYLYLIHVRKIGGNPSDILFKDKPMIINAVLYVIYIIGVVYLPRSNIF